MDACPDSAVLQSFTVGALAAGQSAAIRLHALGCPACLDLLVAIHSATGSVGSSATPDPAPLPAALPPPDRFRVLRRLGQGGMGVVYEALDRKLGRLVAIKTLRALAPEALLRFKAEFRALQDLHHENLVAVGELVEDQGRWCFTMERIEGVDLLSYVRPEGVTDEVRLRAALRQLADGLRCLHGAGKVHRDIKPRNVLVTKEGRLVLLDLGLVSAGPPAEGWREIVGTAAYMAPEQAAGLPATSAADWYAVGVVLHEAITGRVPAAAPGATVDLAAAGPADLCALCADLLAPDAARRPSGDEVQRRLGAAGGEAEGLPEPLPTFVGRESEIRRVTADFAAARDAPRALVITGESGVGKSALVGRAAAELVAAEAGLLVLLGRCYEREWAPYKAVDGVMDALSRALAQLSPGQAAGLLPEDAGLLPRAFPALGRVRGLAWPAPPEVPDPHEIRGRLFATLRGLLRALCLRRPILMIIDDLHWADLDSLTLLAAVLGHPEAPPLLLLCTAQDTDEGREAIRALGTIPQRQVLELGPLPAAHANELARRILTSGAPAADAAALATEAGGHPLFIAELARYAGVGGSSGAAPPRLSDALGRRIRALEPGPRRLLQLVALSGGPLPEEVAVLAGAVAGGGLLREVSVLRRGGLLRTVVSRGAQGLLSYHDRVREAVLVHTAEADRVGLHRSLALAMETWGQASADSLMVHWQGAGELRRAARHATEAAAVAASALAFERAAWLYRQALTLDPDRAPAEARELHERLGDALANAGHGPEGAAALLLAAAGAKADHAARLRQRAGQLLLLAGELAEGTAVFAEVLRASGLAMAATPGRTILSLLVGRARLGLRGLKIVERREADAPRELLRRVDLCWSVAMAFAYFDVLRGADFQVRHLRYALESGEPYRVSRALSMEAGYLAALGGARARRRVHGLLARARELAQRGENPHGVALADMAEGDVAFQEGRWSDVLRLCGAAEARYRGQCQDVAAEIDNCRIFSCLSLSFMGRLRELARRQQAYLREARERRDTYLAICLITGVPVIWLAQDDVERARCDLDEGVLEARRVLAPVLALTELLPRVQIHLYAGEAVLAQRSLEQAERQEGRALGMGLRIRSYRVQLRATQGTCALAAACAGTGRGREGLLRRAALAARRLAGEGIPAATALGALLGAGVAAARGEEAAPAQMLSAAAALEACEMGLHGAAARFRAAALLGGDRGRELAAAAQTAMAAEGVRYADRLAGVYAPG